MRTAIISDVHANLPALKAVLAEIDGMGINHIISAGDVVGYYPYPNEVIQLFRERSVVGIAGNHDRTVIRTQVTSMNHAAGEAARWTARELTESSRAYLAGLPPRTHVTIGGKLIGLYHGSPRDDVEYVFEEEAGPELLKLSGTRLLIMGHTHVPFIHRSKEGTIVNPGSVGQPRDGDPRAVFVVHDSTKDDFTIRRTEYDIESVVKAVERAGLPNDLGERLRHGW
ncbi:MAG TPA: metallophosphoesterase family protein [Methanomassiliicoccales archaeon]